MNFGADGAIPSSMMFAGVAVGGLFIVWHALPPAEPQAVPTGSFRPLVVRALMVFRERYRPAYSDLVTRSRFMTLLSECGYRYLRSS